jgi:hypothetical protein
MSDTTRTEEPRLTLIAYPGLIPFGLVAAATIIMFGVASFSFLDASGGTSRAGIRARGVEVEPVLSGGFLGIDANRPPVSAETELPGSAARATASTFPDSPAAHDMRLPEVTGAQLSPERLAPSASEGNATQEASLNGIAQTRVPDISGAQSVFAPFSASAREGSAKQDDPLNGAAQTRAPEVSGAQPVSEPFSRSVSEGSATQHTPLSGIVPTLPIPAAQRDRVFREFAMHHDQRGKFATSPGAALSRPTPATSQRATPSLGGASQVWLNTASKVYHCPGTRWYGKTNQGGFMSETQALAQGARSDHGKACTGLVRITG